MALYQDLLVEKQEKEAYLAELQAQLGELEAELSYLRDLLKEPFQVTCSECGSVLIITPPSPDTPVAEVITPLYCPVCRAEIWRAATEGYTVSEAIAAEVPWYKKYAPHLTIGGALAGAIVYLTTRKK